MIRGSLAALTEGPSTADLNIDHFPELASVLTIAHEMSQGKYGALVALSGERGAGKTSWMMSLQRNLGDSIHCTLYSIDNRILEPAATCRMLSKILGVTETENETTLIANILQAPVQVVMLDLCQTLCCVPSVDWRRINC